VAVTVKADPPAVNCVTDGLSAIAIVVVAMSHSVNDPPAYEAAPLESTTRVVKVP